MGPLGLTLAMTLTLNFQGQIWNLLYLNQKSSDCHKTKSKHIDLTPDIKCDQWVWPWPWPWHMNFQGKMWSEHLVTKVRCKDLPDSDRGYFRWRRAVDSSSFLMHWNDSYHKHFQYCCLHLNGSATDKFTWGQVMAGCCHATSHYLSQCWPMFTMVLLGHNELTCLLRSQETYWPFLWWIASQQNTPHKILLMLGLCFPQRMLTQVHLWINSMHINRLSNCYFWLMFSHDYFFSYFHGARSVLPSNQNSSLTQISWNIVCQWPFPQWSNHFEILHRHPNLVKSCLPITISSVLQSF